jgi:HSP20 family protein
MVGKYVSRRGKSGHRHPEAGRYLTNIADSRWILPHQGQIWRPPTDVFETDSSIVVKVEVAGMAEHDFSITFSDRNLIVAGIRHDPSAKLGYHQMEIPYGEFRTDVYVSEAIDVDGIEASYENGFLLVTLPKASAHRIAINHE